MTLRRDNFLTKSTSHKHPVTNLLSSHLGDFAIKSEMEDSMGAKMIDSLGTIEEELEQLDLSTGEQSNKFV